MTFRSAWLPVGKSSRIGMAKGDKRLEPRERKGQVGRQLRSKGRRAGRRSHQQWARMVHCSVM